MNASRASRSAYGLDILSGLSIAGLLLPEAVAYSSIGRLPPQAGVIALLAGLLCYALMGNSRFAIVSATSSSAAVLAAATASLSPNDEGLRLTLALGLTLLTGGLFILASWAKLGNMSAFIAKPVLRGFSFGLALVISLKQLPKMTGTHPAQSDMLHFMPELFSALPQWNPWGMALGLAALALLFILAPLRRMPGALIVIALGIALSHFVSLVDYSITLVGPIHFEHVRPSIHSLTKREWLQLGELAGAMVLILYAESYTAIRGFALKHGDTTSPNRDLLAPGVANSVSALFQGMPVGAGFSGTSANESAGARSKLSGVICAGVIFVIVATLLPLIEQTPEPILAAIVIHAVSHTLTPALFRPYWRLKRDRVVLCAAIIAVLVLGVLDGLLVGIAVSLVLMLKRMSEVRVSVLGRLNGGHDFVSLDLHPEATPVSGILIVRPESPLFFGNIDSIMHKIGEILATQKPLNTLIVSLEESPDLDSTCVEAFRDFAHEACADGMRLIIARIRPDANALFLRAAIAELPEHQLSELSIDDAVQLAQHSAKL